MYSQNSRDFDDDEAEFFLDLAMNECQRWLEVICRELFIDSDDFVYSLRYGSHLRKVTNKIIPDCFDLSTERFSRPPRTTRKILENAGVRYTEMEKYIDDEDWVTQLLLICLYRFRIPQTHLFQVEDLQKPESLNEPYKSFILHSNSSEDEDAADVTTCDGSDNDRIRRLCTTVAALADQCRQANQRLPQLDYSALEPLINYHIRVETERQARTLSLHPLDRPKRDIAHILNSIVEQVCFNEEFPHRIETFSPSSDEGFSTMVECSYSDGKYLADLSSEYSTEDLSSYSAGTKSSRSSSPYIGERCFSAGDQVIPTRPQVKLTSQAAHNPLQFVCSKTSAIALSEKAKQQIIVTEQQKRIREEALNMRRNDDDEASWQSNLDTWLSKRKSALSRKKQSIATAMLREEDSIESEKMSRRTKSVDEYVLKTADKEEILTVTSSPPLDEHVDSGIENNRSSSNPHSPSTSLDFSPRSDSKQSSEYASGALSPKYFIRATSPPDAPPPLPPTPPPLPVETTEQLKRENELDQEAVPVSSLLKIDTGRAQRAERKPIVDQVIIGLSVPKSIERNPTDDVLHKDSDAEFPTPSKKAVRDIAAKFECTRTREEKIKVDSSLSTESKRSGASQNSKNGPYTETFTQQSNTASQSKLAEPVKGITLGVELQREQTANVSAVKFPVIKQKSSAEHSCRESIEATSSYVPYTSSALEALRSKGHSVPSQRASSTPVGQRSRSSSSERKQPQIAPEIPTKMPTIMRTVDIPFDDSPSAAYQPKSSEMQPEGSSEPQHGGRLPDADGVMVVNIDLGYHTKNPRKYFGFTVGGGKDKNAPLRIDTVIVGTPADECGLQVGDLILSINGESVEDRYHQSVIRMLHEAARLGEVEMKIKRAPYLCEKTPSGHSLRYIDHSSSSSSFDEKRSMFDKQSEVKDSYYEFRQQKKQQQQQPYKWLERKEQKLSSNSSELDTQCSEVVSKVSRDADTTPTVLRNYDVTPIRSGPTSPPAQESTTNALITREKELTYIPLLKKPPETYSSFLPPPPPPPSSSIPVEEDEEDDDTKPGRSYVDSREWRQIIEQQRLPSPGDPRSKNKIDADSKFRIVHSSAGSIKDTVTNESTKSTSSRHLPPVGITDATRMSRLEPSAETELRKISSATRTSSEFNVSNHWIVKEAEPPLTLSEQLRRQTAVSSPTTKITPQSPIGSRRTAESRKTEEPVVAVSGKHKCSHCQLELGRGAAMIIESLNLFYHLSCFRCYVCNTALGNGTQGADVRVRDSKLHCQSCYSNDEAGLKFSRV